MTSARNEGKFRHRPGDGAKALAFVTDTRNVPYLHTRDGDVLLLSVSELDRMLALLRKARPGARQEVFGRGRFVGLTRDFLLP